MTEPTPDYSYLSTVGNCARMHQLQYEQRLQPNHSVPYLLAGSAMHAGLHALYTKNWDLDAAEQAVYETWGDYVATDKFSYLSPSWLAGSLRHYAARRADDGWEPVQHPEGGIWAEKVMITPLSDGRSYGTLIDLVIKARTGLYYLVDHKTTTGWVTKWWADNIAAVFHQGRGYQMAVERALGHPIAGIIINGVHMGPGAQDDDAKWATRKSSHSYPHGPYQFGPQHLAETDQWARDQLDTLDSLRTLKGTEPWPQNDRSCGGCWFSEICTTAPPLRPAVIARKFHRRDIDPNAKLASGAA